LPNILLYFDVMSQRTTIKDWHESDKPREKLLSQGRKSLSNAELMAILISSGNSKETAVDLAKRILHDVENNLFELGKHSVEELMKYRGIGEAKAVTIVAALELGRRRAAVEPKQRIKITSSAMAYDILNPLLSDVPHEEFWMLLLDRANQVIRKKQISSGGVSGTVVDPKIIFRHALEASASAIILCHNHPSGNLKASQADLNITKKLTEAGKLLDISVLDHLIIGEKGYMSFADEGMM